MPPATEENDNQVEVKRTEKTENNSESPPDQPQQTESPKPKRPKFLKWLVALAVVALIAAAALLAIRSLDNKSEDTDQAQKKDIPSLRIGYTSGPLNSFYPGGYTNSANFMEVNLQIFEGLVRYEDKTKIAPALATGWSNPDSSTWVFNIRPNVKFHTGRTMTSEDVKVSLEAAKTNPDLELYSSTISKIETVDSDKVKITTEGTDPILLNKLNYLFIFDTKSDKKDDPINATGPYVIKPGTEAEEAKVQLAAYDDYYQGRPSTRELELLWYEEQQNAVDDFNGGKLDIVGYLDGPYIEKLNPHEPYVVDPPASRYLRLNTTKPNSPLSKKEFREGLQYLLDKPAIIKTGGSGKPATQIVPQEVPGYDPTIKSPEKDVTKAKALFTAAGYPNGATLSIISSSVPDSIAEIERQFAEGGIKLQVEDIPDFDAFLARVDTGKADLVLQGYSSDFLDGSDFLSELTGYTMYKNEEISKLVDEASQSLDSADRLAKLKQASKLAAEDVAVLPLAYPQDVYGMNKAYILTPDTTSTLVQAYYWKAYQE